MNLKRVSLCDWVVALRNSVLILPVIFIFLSFSCTRQSDMIGLGFVPPGDKIQEIFTDTISVYSSLLRLDSVASYNMGNAIFGSYKDPVFGVTTGNVVTQISPYWSNARFGVNPIADSVVMKIKYVQIYGNRASTVNFKVYELDGLFSTSEFPRHWDTIPHYSDMDITPYLGTQIGQFSYSPSTRPTDSLITFYLNSNYFGNKLIQVDTIVHDSLPLFHMYMKGICIVPQKATSAGEGFLFKTNLGTDYYDLTVYYHNTTLTLNDSSSDYIVSQYDRDARVNTFTHDYSSAKFLSSLNKPTIHDTLAYTESMAGLITKLSFPGIFALKGKSTVITINKAELIIPVLPDDTTHYPPVSLMQLMHLDVNYNYVTTADYNYYYPTDSVGQAYVGGIYDKYNKVYIANINKHLEYSLSQPGYHSEIFLRPSSSGVDPVPGRSILKNGTGANRIKLRITYTKR
jgi:Domain of unknown function (DUF4270)